MASRARSATAFVTAALVVAAIFIPRLGSASQAPTGTVTMEWFGWSHYRFTSPTGKVVLTNPWVLNPDSPIQLSDVTQADIILPADGHGDDMGNALEIAEQTGGTIVSPSFEMGTWFLDKGLPRSQLIQAAGPGDRAIIDGITVRIVNSVHGSGLGTAASERVPYGGPAAGFVITFENGWTAYFAGSSAAHQDQALVAQMYHPDLAILALNGGHEPMDFAMQVKLLMTDNPNLSAVFPHHQRVEPSAGQTTIAEAQSAVDAMGLGQTITTPELGRVYSFSK
ncbi:MAG TPA: MBL fold metallo-hydrolase [Chloroflexota bacterium]|nr:MBL fold metallo-hydrolase [Chloroflexota bacterium]